MRKSFIKTLAELAENDPRILLLTADLGYTVLEIFAGRFPDRFFNVGVAEQNMVGLATGLAESGFIPFLYSIATFAVLRPYEFIRNGPVLHRLPVRIIGVGGGFDYGSAGITHYGLEDIGVMRLQPELKVIAPADYRQACAALRATWELPGPIYYRLGKDEQTAIAGLPDRFELGRVQQIRDGTDVLLISTGSIATEAAAAAERLAEQGLSCRLLIAATLNPAPVEDLVAHLAGFPLAVTVEAHYITGGLGSLVAEIIAEHGLACRLLRCGVERLPAELTGSQNYWYDVCGLSANALTEKILKASSPNRWSI